MGAILKQFNGATVTPVDDARLYDFILASSGVMSGCEVTHLGGNQILVAAGYGIIEGHMFVVTEETIAASVSDGGTKRGRLLLRIDKANPTTPIQLMTQVATTLPTLTQEDLTAGGMVYEYPFATYDINEIAISNFMVVTTAAQGLASRLIGKQNTITGAASTVTDTNLAASRALISLPSGKIGVSATAEVEVFRLQGLRSNAQQQIDAITTGLQITGDLAPGTARVVNVLLGTGSPPAANTVPRGTLFIKYIP